MKRHVVLDGPPRWYRERVIGQIDELGWEGTLLHGHGRPLDVSPGDLVEITGCSWMESWECPPWMEGDAASLWQQIHAGGMLSSEQAEQAVCDALDLPYPESWHVQPGMPLFEITEVEVERRSAFGVQVRLSARRRL